MQNKMIDSFNDQTRQLFEPMRKLNSLMLNNMQRMTEYQMETMRRYSQMGTERMRDATTQLSGKQGMDEQGFKELSARQAEMMNELSQQLMDDAKAFSEMNLQFKAELEAMFAEQTKMFEQLASATSNVASKSATADAASKEAEKDKPAAKSSSKSSRASKKSS
ncbi:MAG: phasin family protein [Halomonas sp.]|uniref:phasin family protein n=1 Tax=Halomonas sp. TaxID=1486246 RepID=UPI003F90A091